MRKAFKNNTMSDDKKLTRTVLFEKIPHFLIKININNEIMGSGWWYEHKNNQKFNVRNVVEEDFVNKGHIQCQLLYIVTEGEYKNKCIMKEHAIIT